MSLIEPTGTAAALRGPVKPAAPASARSGLEKANTLQTQITAAAVAPAETVNAIVQAQSSGKAGLSALPPGGTQPSLSKPMTAVLLHELRLQQELADVQQVKERKQDGPD